MPDIVLHQPIEGGNVLDTVNVPQARADFYVALGYASYPGQNAPVAVPDADADPQLAENREKPDEDLPKPAAGAAEAVEGTYDGTNDDHREAQAEADEQSEDTVEASAELRADGVNDGDVPVDTGDGVVRHTVEPKTTTEQNEAQAQADEKSAEVDKIGDNALNQPGDEVPVTEPAVPAIPAVDPAILEAPDAGEPATKGTRKSKRPADA